MRQVKIKFKSYVKYFRTVLINLCKFKKIIRKFSIAETTKFASYIAAK